MGRSSHVRHRSLVSPCRDYAGDKACRAARHFAGPTQRACRATLLRLRVLRLLLRGPLLRESDFRISKDQPMAQFRRPRPKRHVKFRASGPAARDANALDLANANPELQLKPRPCCCCFHFTHLKDLSMFDRSFSNSFFTSSAAGVKNAFPFWWRVPNSW